MTASGCYGYDTRSGRSGHISLSQAVVTPDQNSAVVAQGNAVIIASGDGDDIRRVGGQDTLPIARRSEQVVRPRAPGCESAVGAQGEGMIPAARRRHRAGERGHDALTVLRADLRVYCARAPSG